MLADRARVRDRVPIYIQPNKRFRLPLNGDIPVIMIGPGTGIAPFRSFLHEQQALGHKRRNWLFFGERSPKTDFLYCEELRAICDNGHLTRLDTAFSRDQAHKTYVQDRMLEQGVELWGWLAEGGQVFVCGDASRMAKDVDAALHSVVERHGGMDAESAKEYVSQLQEDRHYPATCTSRTRFNRGITLTLPLHERAMETDSAHLVRMTLLAGGAAPELVESLIPQRALEPGEQYRFHFDMTQCIGCRSCEVACNEQNGNPSDIKWRRVGELEGGVYPDTQRTYLSMGCNQCLSADCLKGCPVDSYKKDPLTGIVLHSVQVLSFWKPLDGFETT